MSSANVVTTGKYKDKSVSEAVKDKKYIQWLTQQPWYVTAVMIHVELQRSEKLSTVATDRP